MSLSTEIKEGPIFIHIPKTGGISVVTHIKKYLGSLNHNHRSVNFYNLDLRQRNFIFTFVRNPYDRIVSAFYYLKQGLAHKAENDFGKTLHDNFSDFVKKDLIKCININYLHFIPMNFWLNDSVDFIGRFENIQEDYNYVCDNLSIPHNKLQVFNKSKHKHYTEYYDNESKQIVENIYQIDIFKFGYSFDRDT